MLKRIWKASPQFARFIFCAGICSLKAQKRHASPAKCAPVYICAPFSNHSGIAQGARLYARQYMENGMECHLVDITNAMRMPSDRDAGAGIFSVGQAAAMAGPGQVVIHANPPHFQLALCSLGKAFLAEKHVTAYWSWELEKLPMIWKQAFPYVDSIETPSTFVQKIIQRHTSIPVILRPHVLPEPHRVKSDYARGGVLRCLYIFDGGSSYERKNPIGALFAFARAFAPGQATMTFKVINANADSRHFKKLRSACEDVPNVRIITDTLDQQDMESLYLDHDIYLSLHRSEGFGLTICEALRHGLYAVATGWSGNMDFMQGERAFPVPCSLVPVRQSFGACKGLSAVWAEPDIDAAATILKNLRERILA